MSSKTKTISNTKDKKILLSNFFSLTVLQVFTYVLPLLTLPYLVRVLGVEKYGLVMFAQSFIIFFNIFVDFGFNLSAVREVSIHRDDKEKLTEIYSSVMTIKFILILISLFILSIFIFLFDKFHQNQELYYLTFLWVIGQAMFPIWYFQGMEKMKYITIVNITSKLIFTIAIFIFVKEQSDYIFVPILNGLGFIIGGIISLFFIYKVFKQNFKLQNFKTLIRYFKESADFFLSRISVTIYTSANLFVLGLFTNNTMVGYFSIAERLYVAIQSFYQPIVQVLYPYIAKAKNIDLYKKIFVLVVILNIMGIIFLYFFGQNIFDILFTSKIGVESLKVFHILLVSAMIVVPSILFGYPFLGALGYTKEANLSVIYGSAFHLVGLSILSLLDGITIFSVAYLVIATELLVFTLRLLWIRRYRLWVK